jgi:magnesium chelatase family protein
MAITVLGAALQGIDAIAIRVEIDLLRRLPRVCIVGLAAGAVQESAERVRSAITAIGVEFPRQRIVINLAPADVRKDGTAFDLPVALGILAADGHLPMARMDELLTVGELSLNGELRPVRGALSHALLARDLRRTLVLPMESAAQAALVCDADVRGARTLADVVAFVRGELDLPRPDSAIDRAHAGDIDLAEVRGQATARRALEIAAAGAHHMLMMGPPGCGKSMLARRLPTILPPLTYDEAVESSRVHSVAGLLGEHQSLLTARPFRAPHHTVTVAGLIGDRRLRPGEVSLAHNGVLFLDEASEFPRAALEVLRTPLEDGTIRLVRAEGAVEYPASITLVMASNPCACGRRGSALSCTCTDSDVERYRRKLSGPILDRIDLHVELEPVPAGELLGAAPGESSSAVRQRVVDARDVQRARGQRVPNGALPPAHIELVAKATAESLDLLRSAVERLGLSGRSTTRLLKVARTIADLDHAPRVEASHVAEALAFRPVAGLA